MDRQELQKPRRKRCSMPLASPFPIPILSLQENGGPDSWNRCEGKLVGNAVWIVEESHTDRLYTMGFFGKGMLSKSGPGRDDQLVLPKKKTARLSEQDKKALEDDVKTRNKARRKRRRQWLEETQPSESGRPQGLVETDCDALPSLESPSKESNEPAAAEEESLYRVEEYLQLSLCESFFLVFGFGCLVVRDLDGRELSAARLWHSCHVTQPGFVQAYVAYHYLRSKGWVVRTGEKYGVDYLVYKHGPAYYHSNAAILVRMVDEKTQELIAGGDARLPSVPFTWQYLAGVNRINSAVAKDLILLHVLKPSDVSDEDMKHPDCLHRFGVQEVVLRRWIPDRARELNEEDDTVTQKTLSSS
eukprot:m.15452 g.15452  ORF g.15452 m.15452 type:complete len:359 (+) comp26389_c0_seq1:150-1226(+)